jgi:hypothetical protein
MAKYSILFLKFFLIVAALITLVICFFGLPNLARLEAQQHPETLYLAYVYFALAYLATIPFFICLHQIFKLLNYVGQNSAFSMPSINALRNIKYCIFTFIFLIMIGELLLPLFPEEDIAGIVALGIYASIILLSITAFTNVLQKLIYDGIKN